MQSVKVILRQADFETKLDYKDPVIAGFWLFRICGHLGLSKLIQEGSKSLWVNPYLWIWVDYEALGEDSSLITTHELSLFYSTALL